MLMLQGFLPQLGKVTITPVGLGTRRPGARLGLRPAQRSRDFQKPKYNQV